MQYPQLWVISGPPLTNLQIQTKRKWSNNTWDTIRMTVSFLYAIQRRGCGTVHQYNQDCCFTPLETQLEVVDKASKLLSNV